MVTNKSCGTYSTQLYHRTNPLKFFLLACQCNGHSKCINQSICEKCENLTTGKHCETCISGFYGDPTNGGKCQRKSDFSWSLIANKVAHDLFVLIILEEESHLVSDNTFLKLHLSGGQLSWKRENRAT